MYEHISWTTFKDCTEKEYLQITDKNIKLMKTSHQNKQTNCNYTFSNTWNYFVVQKNRNVITCSLVILILWTSLKKVFRLIKAITNLSGGIHTPGPLISVLADNVKFTQCNKQMNKRRAITYLFCCYKGTEKRIYVCYNSS